MQSSNSTYSDGARHTSSYHCYITLNLNQKELYCQVCLHRQGIFAGKWKWSLLASRLKSASWDLCVLCCVKKENNKKNLTFKDVLCV